MAIQTLPRWKTPITGSRPPHFKTIGRVTVGKIESPPRILGSTRWALVMLGTVLVLFLGSFTSFATAGTPTLSSSEGPRGTCAGTTQQCAALFSRLAASSLSSSEGPRGTCAGTTQQCAALFSRLAASSLSSSEGPRGTCAGTTQQCAALFSRLAATGSSGVVPTAGPAGTGGLNSSDSRSKIVLEFGLLVAGIILCGFGAYGFSRSRKGRHS
jgi:hypothetical protein